MTRPRKGHGTADNPSGRFERIAYDRADPDVVQYDPDPDEEAPHPATEYFRDHTRGLIAHNESPDVGFDASINVYRGCSHACAYCLGPDTPVLHADMTWRPIRNVNVGDVLVGFDERAPSGRKARKLRQSVVEAVWWSQKPTIRLETKRTRVLTTAEHLWLQARSFRWSRTDRIGAHDLRYLTVTPGVKEDEDYRVGYLAGLSLGDGTMRFQKGWRSDKLGFPPAYWRVATKDFEPLERPYQYLTDFGIQANLRPFDPGPRSQTEMWKLETRALGNLAVIDDLIHMERYSPSYRRGFLGGFFDAEGHNGDSLRMSQLDVTVLERVRLYAASLGLTFRVEFYPERRVSSLRFMGTSTERIRFFSECRPAIARKIAGLLERETSLSDEPVVSVEATGRVEDVVDIQTSTHTFFANGLATHNCFARPTHEYLGLSAGLDFETKIFVKENAAELLREELSKPSWKPTPLGMSGVTDPYQPIERKLGLTRKCLEVMVEFRQPVLVITKNHLVTRDVDLLAELAQHHAAAAYLSITTLDAKLARHMEPRASSPQKRLDAIETLARAGVPAGVLVAPVIPAITDHEMPRILEAAANAGAKNAGYVILRLPWGLKELFEGWLDAFEPEKKEKVLSRMRALSGGKLYNSEWRTRQHGSGPYAEQVAQMFRISCAKHHLNEERCEVSGAAFRRPPRAGDQGNLFPQN